jgi:hypothetical protein
MKTRNKGKSREVLRSMSPVAPPPILDATPPLADAENALTSLIMASTSAQPSTSAQAESQAAEIARLTQQLSDQSSVSASSSFVPFVLISPLASTTPPEPTQFCAAIANLSNLSRSTASSICPLPLWPHQLLYLPSSLVHLRPRAGHEWSRS